MVITGEIHTPAKKMLTLLSLNDGKIWLYIACIGIFVFLILGISTDPRFFILALMWFFLIIPMGIAFLYFYYGLRPLTVLNAVRHKVIFEGDNIQILLMENEASSESESQTPQSSRCVAAKSFKGIKNGGEYILMDFGKEGWLYLPVSAFYSLDDFKDIIDNYTKRL